MTETHSHQTYTPEKYIGLATKFGRYGYRCVTNILNRSGWKVNHKRVERIWRQEDLKVPKKLPKRARLWLNDGSCIRLRPTHRNDVWSYVASYRSDVDALRTE